MTEEQKKRRAERRNATTPKPLSGVLKTMHQNQFKTTVQTEIPGPQMKAKCKRLANRSVLVGRTNFIFDKNGVMTMKPNGRTSQHADFKMMLRSTGAEEITTNRSVVTLNDARAELELPPLVGGDIPMAPMAKVPVPEVSVIEDAPAEETSEHSEELVALQPQVVKVLDSESFTNTEISNTIVETPDPTAPETKAKRPAGRPKKKGE